MKEPIETIERLKNVNPSASVNIFNEANRMREMGIDIANLSAGESNFYTPKHIKDAAQNALKLEKTKYPPPAGILELREAIAQKFQRENGLNYQVDNIIVSNGGKQGLFNLVFSMIESQDEVIIPSPYWVSHPDVVKLSGGIPIIVKTQAKNSFKLTAKELENNITKRTKLLILTSPANPTGAVYTLSELKDLAEVIIKYDLFVLSDEIYEKILYDGVKHHSIAQVNKEMLERTAISNGFSKSFAMTGWRLGYIAAPIKLVERMTTIQGHITSGVCTLAQYGGIAALKNNDFFDGMMEEFTKRREYTLEYVSNTLNLNYIHPHGAFYVFIDITPFGLSSLEFCEELLKDYKVATVPGIAFGVENYIRISYATDMDSIQKGLVRLREYLLNFQKIKVKNVK